MSIPPIDTNLLIIAAVGLGGLYGAMAGKAHLRFLILSVYVGVVLAQQVTSVVHPFVAMLGTDQLTWLLLGLPIVVFGLMPSGHHATHAERGSLVANLIVGILTGALVAAAALHLLPVSQLATAKNDSLFALQLDTAYPWLLGLMPIVVVLLGFVKPKSHH